MVAPTQLLCSGCSRPEPDSHSRCYYCGGHIYSFEQITTAAWSLEQRLYELYVERRAPSKAIAEELGLSWRQIRTLLVTYGISREGHMHPNRKRPQPDELAAYARAVNYRTAAVAEHYGVSKSCARSWFREFNLPREVTFVPPREELLAARHQERLSFEEIGERYGVSQSTAQRWFLAYEIHDGHKVLPSRRPPTAELLEQYEACGRCTKKLAKCYGVVPSTAWHWLRKARSERCLR